MPNPIGATAHLTRSPPEKITGPVNKKSFTSIKRAGQSIRWSAVQSMVYAPGPSTPGEPPHAHRGRLRRSVAVEAGEEEVVVGPSYTKLQAGGLPPWIASMHERGGTYTGKKRTIRLPARPFMLPALQRGLERFQAGWNSALK